MRYRKWLLRSLILYVMGVTVTYGQLSEPIVQLEDTQKVDPAHPLSDPEATIQTFRLPEGFHAQLFAAEPLVQQPIAFTFDRRGRLWVAENLTYAEQPTNYDLRYRDRIIILEDSDRDGQADHRTVFWADGQRLTSIALGPDGVYALCAPYLVFLPDRNHDDVADGPPEVLLDGWNGEAVRHNVVNGLAWGPDGWLYGRHGIQATSWVGAPGTSPDQRVPINCGIWRYEPERKIFQVVCHGTTNPWGMDWSAEGELFFSNTVIGHLWHVFPGAHFQRMYGEDLVPHLYHLIAQTADHYHWHTSENWSDIRKGMTAATDEAGGGHAHCGLLIYQADNWPERYRGRALMINLHGRRINCDRLEPYGSSFVARHEPDVLRIDDPWFRGIDLQVGPDGAVWIADWCDIGECHENDGVHRTSGRIYRIWHGSPPRPHIPQWDTLSSNQLFEVLEDANIWYVRQTLGEFRRRRLKEIEVPSPEVFARVFHTANDPGFQLRVLWAWHAAGQLTEEHGIELTKHRQPTIRCWAWRLLVDRLAPDALEQLVRERLEQEQHPQVAVTMIEVLRRLKGEAFWRVVSCFARQARWADDKFYVPLLWYHVVVHIPDDPTSAVALMEQSSLRSLRRWIARRLAEEWNLYLSAIEPLAERIANRIDIDWVQDVLTGWEEGLTGRRRVPPPHAWPQVVTRWSNDPHEPIATLVKELSVLFGDGQAVTSLLKLAADSAAPIDKRRRAIATLVATRQSEVRPVLLALLEHRELGVDAVRGLAVWEDVEWIEPVLQRYKRLPPEVQTALLDACVVRPRAAEALLDAIERGVVRREQLNAIHLQQLRHLRNEHVATLVEQLWPSVSQQLDREQRITFYEQQLSPSRLREADPRKGLEIFRRACGSCHKLFGEGGSVGPDLTGAQRHNLRYWLENLLEPSAQVAENFRASTLLLADGRVLVGIVVEQSRETVTIQTATERLRLPVEEVEQVVPSNLSLMPERLLEPFSIEEVQALFAYLMQDSPSVGTSGQD